MQTKISKDSRIVRQLVSGTLFVLVAAILISYVFQISYAQSVSSSPPVLKTFRIKAQLDKSIIGRGNTQTIQFAVVDQKTRQPVGGAITRATVTYPAGTPVRQFSVLTDSAGHSTISWQIEDDAPPGTYVVRYDVFFQGYAEEGFTSNFSVVSHSVDSHHHHHDN